MKKFSFPLGRVMDWRNTQARIEESKLETLYCELRGIEAKKTALQEERSRSEAMLDAARSITGSELAAFDTFRRFTIIEQTRIEAKRAECSQRVAAQVQGPGRQRRREVRLLLPNVSVRSAVQRLAIRNEPRNRRPGG